ncbi:MAG: thioredoxin family protein [Rhodospirillales bacterium]|nr:thioredoxin family protein [Rhodospirillales bacterium]
MALTPSTMLELGTPAPTFSLPDTEGNTVSLNDFANSKALLVMFVCNHCPFVKHVAAELARLANDHADKGLGVVAIMSNDVANYPDDSPEKMKQFKAEKGWSFPYLYDETQEVAKAYTAACTPDFFLFDDDRKLFYRGQLDETRPQRISSGNYNFDKSPAHGSDLRAAINAVLAGSAAPEMQLPSMGCNIKWKADNAPAYA